MTEHGKAQTKITVSVSGLRQQLPLLEIVMWVQPGVLTMEARSHNQHSRIA